MIVKSRFELVPVKSKFGLEENLHVKSQTTRGGGEGGEYIRCFEGEEAH